MFYFAESYARAAALLLQAPLQALQAWGAVLADGGLEAAERQRDALLTSLACGTVAAKELWAGPGGSAQ
ncbi:hypothetical protein ACLB1G_24910 [Oxalobacteraceae bacterium A2-2]